MTKNLKHIFFHSYIDFFEKEYVSVLNSFRTLLSMIVPIGLFVFTRNLDFIWLALCCFLWALHLFKTETVLFQKNMFISLGICTVLQILGFLAHVEVFTYCLFAFLTAFLIPYFAYFKKVIFYDLAVYFIVQNSSFFEKDLIEMGKSVGYSIVAFFIVLIVGTYGLRVNLKKQLMYRLKVNWNVLSDYLEGVKDFIANGSKKNYWKLGKKRSELFRSVQIFREIYPLYINMHKDDTLAKIAPIQERFIETTVGFCLQIRNIHVQNVDLPAINEIFKQIQSSKRGQRGIIFEAHALTERELLTRYQAIFEALQTISIIHPGQTNLSTKERGEMNSAILQFKESISLMQKDIQKNLLTT